ncbi:Phosphatidylinositol N-acetylglucosaminyltransferase subunit A [Halotydeus destructor]|nr:Phosphatidylinositol N-acetylglucosaminyltransferase subunit A [Halotydeus destructor]
MVKNVYRICMASDFFYPNTGGVESHIYQLSQCLIKLGHKVVIITHAYDDRKGVRYMTSGMKVYYLPLLVIYNQCTLPTLFATFPIIRYILLREQIDIVHGHSAFSALAHEVMAHATTIGLRTIFTDHSLFGFADASAILTNKLLQMSLTTCDQVICVSYVGKENTTLRAGVPPSKISVIPNAVDTAVFTPDPNKRNAAKITVVVISRLVYRKGVDLLAGVIPIICRKHPSVQFIIGGDGPKRIVLEELIEKNLLQDRVVLLGAIKHEDVRDVLVRGDIFLNSSLTEAFCMAIVEAAACGLQVVSTNVGGIPEVLPDDIIWLADASVSSIVAALEHAITDKIKKRVIGPFEAHKRISKYYQWDDIARRTQLVYDSVMSKPVDEVGLRLIKLRDNGKVWGVVFVFIFVIEHFLHLFYSWLVPENLIDKCPELREGDDDVGR